MAQEIIDLDPRPLVKGLLHSDGCRVLTWVNGTPYPRYHFTNVSPDIREIYRTRLRPAGRGVAAEQPGQPLRGPAGECGAA